MLNNILKDKRKGAVTFELAVSFPFMVMLGLITLFFCLMFISWTSYGALSSELAKDLNLRSTGLQTANASIPSSNVLFTGTNGDKNFSVTKSQFTVNSKSSGNKVLNSYKNAVMYKAIGYKDQFFLPYCRFKKCNVDVLQLGANGTYNTNISPDNTLSNYIIRVTIDYDFMSINIMGYQMPTITVHTNGYSVVT